MDIYRTGVGVSLGFEPTWFVGDCFSAVCDCMCFPKWHGTDKEGVLFVEHYERLNQHALFNSRNEAQAFLDFYRSFDWKETGNYVIAEICLPEELPNPPLQADRKSIVSGIALGGPSMAEWRLTYEPTKSLTYALVCRITVGVVSRDGVHFVAKMGNRQTPSEARLQKLRYRDLPAGISRTRKRPEKIAQGLKRQRRNPRGVHRLGTSPLIVVTKHPNPTRLNPTLMSSSDPPPNSRDSRPWKLRDPQGRYLKCIFSVSSRG